MVRFARIAGRTLVLLAGAIVLIYGIHRLTSGGMSATFLGGGIVAVGVVVMALGFRMGRSPVL